MKKYYSLSDIADMGHLKSRRLSTLVKEVEDKYRTNSDLIFKKKRWYISEDILHEFGRKQQSEENYKSVVHITWKDNVKKDYIKEVMRLIFDSLLKERDTLIGYYIETHMDGRLHVHMVINWELCPQLTKKIKKVLKVYCDQTNVIFGNIYSYPGLYAYLNKDYLFKETLGYESDLFNKDIEQCQNKKDIKANVQIVELFPVDYLLFLFKNGIK